MNTLDDNLGTQAHYTIPKFSNFLVLDSTFKTDIITLSCKSKFENISVMRESSTNNHLTTDICEIIIYV